MVQSGARVMRDIDEVLDRLAEATRAVREIPPGTKLGDYRRAAHAAGMAWDDYLDVMLPLDEDERLLVDPLWPERSAAAVGLHAERMEFYRQQTENIRTAWFERENA